MNLDHLEKCAQRQHKGTMAIVEKMVGLPQSQIKMCPIIVKKGTELCMYSPYPADCEYISPYIMNGGFSLELKMKYLHYLETGKQIESGHKLRAIYCELTDASKKALRENLKEVVKNCSLCKEAVKFFNSEYKIQFNWDIHKLLSNSNMAFERWRYIYEGKNDPTWFAGYSEIQASVDIRINNLKNGE
ncbi:MAG: hypothetical protein Q7U57_05205 [Methylovulum sp.]|nr:hypothetical protein [Methylovulum sp.]